MKTTATKIMVKEGTAPIVLSHPREPPLDKRFPGLVPENSLEQIERAHTFKRWGDTETLRHVFILKDSGRISLENVEGSIESWIEFRTEILKTFTKVLLKARAEFFNRRLY